MLLKDHWRIITNQMSETIRNAIASSTNYKQESFDKFLSQFRYLDVNKAFMLHYKKNPKISKNVEPSKPPQPPKQNEEEKTNEDVEEITLENETFGGIMNDVHGYNKRVKFDNYMNPEN